MSTYTLDYMLASIAFTVIFVTITEIFEGIILVAVCN